MPSLLDALGQDLSKYTEVEKSSPQAAISPVREQQPVLNSMLRCPLPPIFQASPDNLRQFYQGGHIPQYRIFNPPLQPNTSGTNTTTTEVVSSGSGGGGSGGGSGGGTTPSTPPTVQSASITSGVLNTGSTFASTITVAKGFQLIGVSVSSPARVQLYGTALAQSLDAHRGLDIPPAAGTAQNIICDVALDTAPYRWAFQSRTGANADSPQSSTIYVTLTNIDVMSDTITMTLAFVPLES